MVGFDPFLTQLWVIFNPAFFRLYVFINVHKFVCDCVWECLSVSVLAKLIAVIQTDSGFKTTALDFNNSHTCM